VRRKLRVAARVLTRASAIVCGFIGAAWLVPCAQGTELASAITPPEPLFAAPTRMDRTGRILAPVMINGQGPFRLIVDTGASHSTLSIELATALGLEPSDEFALVLNGVTGTARVPGVFIDRLQAGDLAVKRTRMPVLQSTLLAGADGVLGLAGLDANHVFVDFRKDRVVIARKRQADALRSYALIQGSRIRDGLIAVDARILRVRTVAIVDTGAERSLGNLALRDAVRKQLSEGEVLLTAEVTGVTMEVAAGESGAAPRITLGEGIKIDDVPITYGDFHIFKVWNLEKRPALLLGMDVLGLVDAFEIDFAKAEVRIATRNMRRE
jgi:predicted aspartyl protease